MITKKIQVQNIHRRDSFIQKCIVNQEKKLSPKNFETFMAYNDNMIIDSIANTTRYKNLSHFAELSKTLQKDWVDVTEDDLKLLVGTIMTKHSPSGKETSYTAVLKLSLKQIVRFVKLGSRAKPEDGELKILRFIKSKRVKGKIVREDLPTDDEIRRIIQACADSSRDKAMFALHADAGTRIGELPIQTYESHIQNTTYPTQTIQYPDGTQHEIGEFSNYVETSFTNVIDDVYENSYSDEDFVFEVWYIISNLTVYSPDIGEHPRYALETLTRCGGDCEDTTILMADMLKSSIHTGNWNIQMVYFDSENPTDPKLVNHVALAVNTGKKFGILETTAKNVADLTTWNINSIVGWWSDV